MDNEIEQILTIQPISAEDARQRMVEAIALITLYGGIDGAHHKQWVIDQTLRCLCGQGYDTWRRAYAMPDENGDRYGWDEGISP